MNHELVLRTELVLRMLFVVISYHTISQKSKQHVERNGRPLLLYHNNELTTTQHKIQLRSHTRRADNVAAALDVRPLVLPSRNAKLT